MGAQYIDNGSTNRTRNRENLPLKNGVWSWSELSVDTLEQNMMTRIKNFEKCFSIGRLYIIWCLYISLDLFKVDNFMASWLFEKPK